MRRVNPYIRRGSAGCTFGNRLGGTVTTLNGVVFLYKPLIGEAAANGVDGEGRRVVFAGPNRVGVYNDTRLLEHFYRYRVFAIAVPAAGSSYAVGIGVVGFHQDGVEGRVGLDKGAAPLVAVSGALFGVENFGREVNGFALEDGLKLASLYLHRVVNHHKGRIPSLFRTGAHEAGSGADINLIAVFEAVDVGVAGKGHGVFVLHPAVFHARVFGRERVGGRKEGHAVVRTDVERIVYKGKAVVGGNIYPIGVYRVNGFGDERRGSLGGGGANFRTRHHLTLYGALVGEAAVAQGVGGFFGQLHAVEIPFKLRIYTPIFTLHHIGYGVGVTDFVARDDVAVEVGEVGRYLLVVGANVNRVAAKAVVLALGHHTIGSFHNGIRSKANTRSIIVELNQARRGRPRVGNGGIVGRCVGVDHLTR